MKYTKTQLKQILTDWYEKKQYLPKAKDFNADNKLPDSSIFKEVFNCGWKELLEVTGLNKKHLKIKQSLYKNIILEWIKKNRRFPKLKDFKDNKKLPDPGDVLKVFDLTWNQILKVLGVNKQTLKNKKQLYKKIILDWVKKNKRSPKIKDFKKDKKLPNPNVILTTFDLKWKEILKKFGVKVYNKRYTKDEVIKFIKQWYKEHKIIPSSREFSKTKNYPPATTLMGICGLSWNEMLKKAGLNSVNVYYSKEDIIRILKDWYNKNKRIPRISDFNNCDDLPCASTIIKFLEVKNWKEVVSFLGLKYTKNKYTKKQLSKIIKDYHKKVGRKPKCREFKTSNNLPAKNAILNIFGCTWNEVLIQLGIELGEVRRK